MARSWCAAWPAGCVHAESPCFGAIYCPRQPAEGGSTIQGPEAQFPVAPVGILGSQGGTDEECTSWLKQRPTSAAATYGGKPEDYRVVNETVSGRGRSMTFAQAATKAI